MSKGGSQTTEQRIDPETQRYVDTLRQAAQGYAGIGNYAGGGGGGTPGAGAQRQSGGFYGPGGGRLGGIGGYGGMTGYAPPPGAPAASPLNLPQATMDPALLQALQGYQGYAQAGQTGLTALSGGANPFMNQYLDTLNPVYDQIRAQSLGSIGDQAQLAGAFGGSRHGVAEGTALGQIGQNQAASHIDAYNQSQGRAAQAAQLGLAGLGGQGNLAQYMQEYPQLFASRQLGLLNQGIGPYGQTQTTKTKSDPFSQLLGIGSFFLPGGPLAGLFKKGASANGMGASGNFMGDWLQNQDMG